MRCLEQVYTYTEYIFKLYHTQTNPYSSWDGLEKQYSSTTRYSCIPEGLNSRSLVKLGDTSIISLIFSILISHIFSSIFNSVI